MWASPTIRYVCRFTNFRPSSVQHSPVTTTTSGDQRKILDDVICVGWDGHPLNDSQEKSNNSEGSRDRRNGKLTEAGDTPAPMAAGGYVSSDGGAESAAFQTSYYGGQWEGGVLMYGREKEIDGVDEAMSLAEKMYEERRKRGDPDSPQAKVLAKLGKNV